jgi:hypothetical protein
MNQSTPDHAGRRRVRASAVPRHGAGPTGTLARGPRTIRALTAAVVVGTALGLAACGSDEKSSGAAAKQPSGSVEEQLGFETAEIMARQVRVEAFIRDCMKAEGFDYIPVDPLAQRAAITGSSRLSDEDFIQQFGYGISTFWGRGGAEADPNQRLRRSLGPADRTAYDRVLWGENVGTTFAEAVDTGNFAKLGGCTRKATEAVFGGAQVLTQLQRRLDQLDERILEDQRMVRALERWSGCMADAGFRYEDPEMIDSELFDRMEAIVGPLPGQFATGPEPGKKPPPYNRAALAELQRDEVAIARADLACELKHIAPVEEVVRPQYEAQFRERNEGLITQVKPVR